MISGFGVVALAAAGLVLAALVWFALSGANGTVAQVLSWMGILAAAFVFLVLLHTEVLAPLGLFEDQLLLRVGPSRF